MDGHGCRHVLWATGTELSVGFYHPFWTIAYSRCYGRKEYRSYTDAVEAMVTKGIPGPIVNYWYSLYIDDVKNAADQQESQQAKDMMTSVYNSKGPVIVTQDGELLYDTDELGVSGMRSFDFLSENTRSRLPADDEGDDIDAFTEDDSAEQASWGLGHTTGFNEYKGFAADFAKYTEADPAMHSVIMREYHMMEARIREEFHKRHPARVPPGAASTTLNPVRMNMLHLRAS